MAKEIAIDFSLKKIFFEVKVIRTRKCQKIKREMTKEILIKMKHLK